MLEIAAVLLLPLIALAAVGGMFAVVALASPRKPDWRWHPPILAAYGVCAIAATVWDFAHAGSAFIAVPSWGALAALAWLVALVQGGLSTLFFWMRGRIVLAHLSGPIALSIVALSFFGVATVVSRVSDNADARDTAEALAHPDCVTLDRWWVDDSEPGQVKVLLALEIGSRPPTGVSVVEGHGGKGANGFLNPLPDSPGPVTVQVPMNAPVQSPEAIRIAFTCWTAAGRSLGVEYVEPGDEGPALDRTVFRALPPPSP